jgi:hypothetical protein
LGNIIVPPLAFIDDRECCTLPPDLTGEPMCEQCNEISNKILHYREILKQPFDSLTVERIAALIRELEQRKALLH